MPIFYSFLAVLTISQGKGITKFVKVAICTVSFIQLAPKLIPYFWPIFTDFQNGVFS